jgi:hypothetical protein
MCFKDGYHTVKNLGRRRFVIWVNKQSTLRYAFIIWWVKEDQRNVCSMLNRDHCLIISYAFIIWWVKQRSLS